MAAHSKWRTSRDARATSVSGATDTGVIGPNAILQLLPILDRACGPDFRAGLLARAGIAQVPDGKNMIPEDGAAGLHRQLRLDVPEVAPVLAAEAGLETANYILRHRIPTPAQWVLKALPKGPAARMLSRAIAQHAWTFVGSGCLEVVDPWTFQIARNPLIKGERSASCLCDWHAGVFSRLYQTLVTPGCTCVETRCGAQAGGDICRFELRIHA